jgi:ABC-type dipeptide/oligopeptide/nickel transport system ATPase subunit
VLAAHGLSFAWPRGPTLFRDLDLHLPRGAVLALAGPSGCGKTALGNVLIGLLRPDEGEVPWAGAEEAIVPALNGARRFAAEMSRAGLVLAPPAMTIQ